MRSYKVPEDALVVRTRRTATSDVDVKVDDAREIAAGAS